jgi:ribosomal protein S4
MCRASWRPRIWKRHQPRGAGLVVVDKEEFKGTVMRIPTRDEIQPIANEQAVVEFYSR